MSITLEPLVPTKEHKARSTGSELYTGLTETPDKEVQHNGDAGNEPLSVQSVASPADEFPRQTSYMYRIVRNFDPLFAIVGLVSLLMMSAFLIAVHQYHNLNIKEHQRTLQRESAALDKRFSSLAVTNDERMSGDIVRSSDNFDIQDLDQNKSPDQMTAAHDAASAETGASFDSHGEDSADYLLSSDLFESEIENLKLLLAQKAEQIDVLALENHELRLSLEFGAAAPENNFAQDLKVNWTSHKAEHLIAAQPPQASSVITSEITVQPRTNQTTSDNKVADASLDELIGLGYQAYIVGEYSAARGFYNEAVQLSPYSRDANLGSAAVASKLNQYKMAEDRYRHLLSLDPDDTTAFASLLMLSVSSMHGSVSNIEYELQTHIEQSSKQPAALYTIVGRHYSRNGDWQLACNMFARAIDTEARPLADYFFNLAVCLDHLGEQGEAVKNYVQALHAAGSPTFDPAEVEQRLIALRD